HPWPDRDLRTYGSARRRSTRAPKAQRGLRSLSWTPELRPVAHSAVRPRRGRRTHGRHAAPATSVWREIQPDLALDPRRRGRLEVTRDANHELATESRRTGVAAGADRSAHCADGVDHGRDRHFSTCRV